MSICPYTEVGLWFLPYTEVACSIFRVSPVSGSMSVAMNIRKLQSKISIYFFNPKVLQINLIILNSS